METTHLTSDELNTKMKSKKDIYMKLSNYNVSMPQSIKNHLVKS